MERIKKRLIGGGMAALLVLLASPALARSISLKEAGTALWIFIIIGAIIVPMQLIPAAILFFSFIGTSSGLLFKRKAATEKATAEEREKIVFPEYEGAAAKK